MGRSAARALPGMAGWITAAVLAIALAALVGFGVGRSSAPDRAPPGVTVSVSVPLLIPGETTTTTTTTETVQVPEPEPTPAPTPDPSTPLARPSISALARQSAGGAP